MTSGRIDLSGTQVKYMPVSFSVYLAFMTFLQIVTPELEVCPVSGYRIIEQHSLRLLEHLAVASGGSGGAAGWKQIPASSSALGWG